MSDLSRRAVVFGHVIRRGRMQLPVRSVGLSAFGERQRELPG
jgi:hypothetical protein